MLFNNYISLKNEIFASHLLICVLCRILKNLNMLFLIFSPIFLIEFFMPGRFSIEVKYWQWIFKNLNKKKQTNKQTSEKEKQLSKHLFETNCVWDLLYFLLKLFLEKKTTKVFHFIKSTEIQAASNDWVMKMILGCYYWILGYRRLLRSMNLVL